MARAKQINTGDQRHDSTAMYRDLPSNMPETAGQRYKSLGDQLHSESRKNCGYTFLGKVDPDDTREGMDEALDSSEAEE